MASGKKNYFRHSFNARNDEFIVSLMNEFGEKGYYMWFALCEMSGELLADGHSWPLKYNQSRLYKELRCNHSKLHLFLTYCQDRSKISSAYVEPIFSLEIPSLSKFVGKYSENAPNKRKEKEIKENEIKLSVATDDSKKILPSAPPQEILKKPSPISFLFDQSPEIQLWLNAGIHETHLQLLKKYSHHEVVDIIERAFQWAKPKGQQAGAWLYTFSVHKPAAAYKGKSRSTPGNPTGNPYLNDDGSLKEQA
jgi:hypothetical protein